MSDEADDPLKMPDGASKENPAAPRPAIWRSEDLFHGEREIVIQHGDQLYRLRRTRQGKLILHK